MWPKVLRRRIGKFSKGSRFVTLPLEWIKLKEFEERRELKEVMVVYGKIVIICTQKDFIKYEEQIKKMANLEII